MIKLGTDASIDKIKKKIDLGVSLGFYPNDRVLDKLIHESDVDNNMVIDFEEFVDLGGFSN